MIFRKAQSRLKLNQYSFTSKMLGFKAGLGLIRARYPKLELYSIFNLIFVSLRSLTGLTDGLFERNSLEIQLNEFKFPKHA